MVSSVTWAAGLGAIGAVITPIVVAILGLVISGRLKRIELKQWHSQELIAARLGYYREIAEPLNDLYCYFTYIGTWKNHTPPDIIEIKRSLDRTFHTLSPFFSVTVVKSYNDFMDLCFQTFGRWGADAKLKTSVRRRKEGYPAWLPEWDEMFVYSSVEPTPPEVLERIKTAYNETLAHLVGDIEITAARTDYSTARIVLNT